MAQVDLYLKRTIHAKWGGPLGQSFINQYDNITQIEDYRELDEQTVGQIV